MDEEVKSQVGAMDASEDISVSKGAEEPAESPAAPPVEYDEAAQNDAGDRLSGGDSMDASKSNGDDPADVSKAGEVSVENHVDSNNVDVSEDSGDGKPRGSDATDDDSRNAEPVDNGSPRAEINLEEHKEEENDDSLKDTEINELNETANDNESQDIESQGNDESQENDRSQENEESQEIVKAEENDESQENIQSHGNDVSEENVPAQENDQNQENVQKNEESQELESVEASASTAEEGRDQDDDVANPIFENAPEPTEQVPEDHSEALDPFDELLKGADDASADKTAASQADGDAAADHDDDENLDADDHQDADDHHDADEPHEIDDDDAPPEDAPHEDSVVEEVGEPGEDEEVCLLPDMEREISQADKEKALEKSKLLQETQSAIDLDVKSVEEAEGDGAEAEGTEGAEGEGEAAVEIADDADAAEQLDISQDDSTIAEDKEKETDGTVEIDDSLPPNVIQEIGPVDNPCVQCGEDKPCTYKFLRNNTMQYLCSPGCLKAFQDSSDTQYTFHSKKYIIEEIIPSEMTCSECEEVKLCYFYYNSDGVHTNYCSLECLHSMMADEQYKYAYKRRHITIEEIDEAQAVCDVCSAEPCTYRFERYGEDKHVCSIPCIKKLNDMENSRYRIKKRKLPVVKKTNIPILKKPLLKLKVISNATDKYLDEGYKIQAKTPAAAAAAREDRERSFIRKCVQCNHAVNGGEKNLSWETMDFCNETCLQRYQNIIGSKCANCKNTVNHTSLGKYCVRFGYDIRQFCCSTCLEEFKKGLKICCYCQRDISVGFEGFLAPVGDKGQFKDFCSQQCMGKFEQMSKNPIPQPVWAKCAVCSVEKPTQIEVGIDDDHSQRLCSDPCFAAFKFVNSICPDQCRWCKKYFERKSDRCFTIYTELATHCFCSKSCMNVYISNSRHIVPCNWCKVKKYNFDMIRRTLANAQSIMMCSLNCLNLYQVSVNAVSSRRIKCDMCKRTSQAQYHLTMSDATVRNFCTYQCVMSFQGQYAKHGQPMMVGEAPQEAPKAVPTGAPRRTYSAAPHRNNAAQQKQQQQQQQQQGRSSLPVISNVQSLAAPPAAPKPPAAPIVHATRGKSKRLQHQAPPPEPEPPRIQTPPPPPKPPTPPPPPPPKIYNHVLVKTLPPVEVANKATMTKPTTVTKGVSCRPHPCTKECQTDPSLERRVLIPVPVPIYVPVPIAMYSLPFPIPVPIPLPIPTPVFIPTTRNSAKGIMKEITKIHDKMPTDPFEAELLMMAEMVAGDKKKSESDSETDDDNDEGFSPDAMDGGNAFGEDMLQMALKMASEYEEPAVDLESAMTASTITPSSHPGMPGLEGEAAMHHHHQMMVLEQQRAVAVLRASQTAQAPAARGKRAPPAAAPVARAPRASKRRRAQEPAPPPPEPAREPVEKPDANMCLKYTFGVNAWKQWVMTKNAEIEKSSIRRKPFKSEILQLTADELNYSLCLFVKEVRKPNGSEYAPDTIYYLVLGIQQYLFENGRIDNIFTDPYYEKFTECLDEVARKFSVLYNDSQYIVTRVEEEHLWESKQLGAHSPHVLLSTLMFFNTKHFNLVTVEEHMQLSFSHIMKHWKRSPNQPGAAKMPGSRNVLLRFYPPQAALEANSRKKKVYEQQENEENPLRCPVKLYEFYISKCPESVRTRNDVFYLMPERSCVPDSPVWYSTQALGRDALAKMLHRVKMVKEINIALLTS